MHIYLLFLGFPAFQMEYNPVAAGGPVDPAQFAVAGDPVQFAAAAGGPVDPDQQVDENYDPTDFFKVLSCHGKFKHCHAHTHTHTYSLTHTHK